MDSDFKSNNCFFPNKDFAENEQGNESEQDGVDEESERANSVEGDFKIGKEREPESNTENSKGIRLNDTDSKAVVKLSVVGSHQIIVYGMSQDDQIWKEKSPIQSRITILESKTLISVDFATVVGFNT